MIQARGLTRQFRHRGETVEAVRDLTLDVVEGEIIGFLGPNGAGKTTAMRMLTTSLRPTSGQALIAGHDLLKDPGGVRRCIGYVPQGTGLYDDNTVAEELVLQGRLHRMTARAAGRRALELVEWLELGDIRGRLTKTLSGGQRRRVDVALALIHRPRLLFLDEPTAGLDPQSRANLWDHIRSLRAETTIFLTTHYLDEADGLANRIFVLDRGEIVTHGTPNDLKAALSDGDLVHIGVAASTVDEATRLVRRLDGVTDVEVSGTLISFRALRGETVLAELMRALAAADVVVLSLKLTRATLDDVFLSLTGRSLRDDVA